MNTRALPLAAGALLLLAATASAQWLRTLHDGFTGEWAVWPVLATDAAGDGNPDLQQLQASRDETSLTFRLRCGTVFLLQESNTLKMVLDTDCNTSTGTLTEGLGAELVWTFGSRSGSYRYGSTNAITVRHDDLALRCLPTHSGDDFEITLDLAARPDGTHLLFPGDSLRAVFYSPSGDRIPASGSATVRLGAGSLPAQPVTPLPRQGDGTLRVAAWNVLNDSIFNTSLTAVYDRLLTALAPDVISFEEVWNETAAQMVTRLNQLVPELGPWTAVKLDSGNIIAARFPIRGSWMVQPATTYRETAALIDVSAVTGDSLLFIACHLRCCTADAARQDEADGLVQFLKDARTLGGVLTLPAGTPMVLAGDFNLVGDRQQLATLLTGDIVDNGAYGPDSPPDWDGSALADLVPLHLSVPEASSWWDNGSPYAPGRLDFILYTDSVLEAVRGGIVATPTLSASQLAAWGLQSGDSWTASDHYPVFADFRPPQAALEAPDLHIEHRGDGSLRLWWGAVTGATAYRVESSLDGAAWSAEAQMAGTEWLRGTPSLDERRLYRVAALN